jgi:hypothetical protein
MALVGGIVTVADRARAALAWHVRPSIAAHRAPDARSVSADLQLPGAAEFPGIAPAPERHGHTKRKRVECRQKPCAPRAWRLVTNLGKESHMQKKSFIASASLTLVVAGLAVGCGSVAAPTSPVDDSQPETVGVISPLTSAAPAEDPVVLQMERNPGAYFNRVVTATDAAGLSRVQLRIVSNDADAADLLGRSQFTLRTGSAAHQFPPDADDSTDADDSDETEDRVKVLLFEERTVLAAGVKNYSFTVTPPSELKLPWKNYYFYTSEDCVEVTRLKLLRRVYASIWSQAVANGAWSTLVSNEKLAWHETAGRCSNNSFRMKAKARAKKSNAFSFGTDAQ